MALENGLSAAIVNPHSDAIRMAYHSYNALHGLDEGLGEYISLVTESKEEDVSQVFDLKKAIFKGMKEQAAVLAGELLSSKEPMAIINEDIIPAINEVGEGFEKKTLFLPSLLMSAEAAGAAFEVIKYALRTETAEVGAKVILATVKGDIHDIGKNIVKLLLENYGAQVIDLGKDVSPERIVAEAEREGADLVGLSALMTTTLPSMERTVALLKEHCPKVKTMVGGAVLTPEYAERIGADYYGADAMAAVKIFKSVTK
jgi:5-methyltetrahydrofolate--homocysteine methyltransferase